MKNCYACAQPDSGHVNTGCRACLVRDLARGPLFFGCVRAGKMSRDYRAALRAIGGEEAATHAEVKAAAKRLSLGATAA